VRRKGDVVNVKFDLRGREYNGQYYVDLNAWRIERGDQAGGAEAGQQPAAVSAAPMPPVQPMPAAAPADDDDLPF